MTTGASRGARCDRGVFLAAQSLPLTMEDAGGRDVAVLHDDARILAGLTLWRDWHRGRRLAQIAGPGVRLS